MSRVAGILLAAGGGSRFHAPGHKLLAELRGRPVVAHAVENMAASHLPSFAVVTGSVDLAGVLPPGVTVLHNASWADGQATSLATAVRWAAGAGLEAIIVGLGDQPGVPPSAWDAVAACSATPIAVATYGGRRGHPVRLHRSVWERLPVTGDRGARDLLAGSPELVTEVACDGDPGDVDTVEDLARCADAARVAELLGRSPRGRVDVVVRGAGGDPVVIRNDPVLPDGTPMPTRYWLVGAAEVAAVSRLEAIGGVRQAEAAVPAAEVADAHRRYAAERDAALPPGSDGPRPAGGVGGTRTGVKCLHAHYAWFLAGGDDPVGRWVAERLAR